MVCSEILSQATVTDLCAYGSPRDRDFMQGPVSVSGLSPGAAATPYRAGPPRRWQGRGVVSNGFHQEWPTGHATNGLKSRCPA